MAAIESARKAEEERKAAEEALRKAEVERKAAEEAARIAAEEAKAKELAEQQKLAEKTEEKEEPEHVDDGPKDVFEKISGRFIVKSNKGYVVSKGEFSNNKAHARVFDDFNEARRYKAMFGGKVIKL